VAGLQGPVTSLLVGKDSALDKGKLEEL
jgi:hypothetical protein